MTALLKAQMNEQDTKISKMQDMLDSQAVEIRSLRTEVFGTEHAAVKEYSLMDPVTTGGSQMDTGTLNSLKEDVQTVIDAMRVDLGRQKTELRSLADQVQGG